MIWWQGRGDSIYLEPMQEEGMQRRLPGGDGIPRTPVGQTGGSQAVDPRKGSAEVWRAPDRSNETLQDRGSTSPRWGWGWGALFDCSCGSLEAATPLCPLGSHTAGSTTLDINHQNPQRPTGLPDFKEECRKGGGRTAFSG